LRHKVVRIAQDTTALGKENKKAKNRVAKFFWGGKKLGSSFLLVCRKVLNFVEEKKESLKRHFGFQKYIFSPCIITQTGIHLNSIRLETCHWTDQHLADLT
jgi:hypothetical protein